MNSDIAFVTFTLGESRNCFDGITLISVGLFVSLQKNQFVVFKIFVKIFFSSPFLTEFNRWFFDHHTFEEFSLARHIICSLKRNSAKQSRWCKLPFRSDLWRPTSISHQFVFPSRDAGSLGDRLRFGNRGVYIARGLGMDWKALSSFTLTRCHVEGVTRVCVPRVQHTCAYVPVYTRCHQRREFMNKCSTKFLKIKYIFFFLVLFFILLFL